MSLILRPFVADRKSVVPDVPCAQHHVGRSRHVLQQYSFTEPSNFPASVWRL
jgi:hypothetical protein